MSSYQQRDKFNHVDGSQILVNINARVSCGKVDERYNGRWNEVTQEGIKCEISRQNIKGKGRANGPEDCRKLPQPQFAFNLELFGISSVVLRINM